MRYDIIIIGGGRSGLRKGLELQKSGLKCLIFSTGEGSGRFKDPSYDHRALRSEFERAGGSYVMGDTVTGGTFDDDGSLVSVHTSGQGNTAFCADRFYLATGSFFSRGLVASRERIYEPVFGLDVDAPSSREQWVNPDFFADQPFMHFGVRTDGDGRPMIGGRTINNLFAIGSITGNDTGQQL